MSVLTRCTLLLCLLGSGGSAGAAPTTTPLPAADSDVAPVSLDSRDAAPSKDAAVDPAAARDVPNSSNAIKMLLELQTAPEANAGPTGATSSGRTAPRPAAARPPGQGAVPGPFANGDNPFGASPDFVRPPASASGARSGVEWQAAPNAGSWTGAPGGASTISVASPDLQHFPGQRARGAASGDVTEPRWWMPSAWIRWVREHRQEVLIGAAVALALAWASASRSAARRR